MTPSNQITILESQLQNEREKSAANAREHDHLLRRCWATLDEVQEWRRDALERAAREVLR